MTNTFIHVLTGGVRMTIVEAGALISIQSRSGVQKNFPVSQRIEEAKEVFRRNLVLTGSFGTVISKIQVSHSRTDGTVSSTFPPDSETGVENIGRTDGIMASIVRLDGKETA